jgi:putative ABC transport system permease protein
MIKNYLLIAWRYAKKNKVFSFINILGLAAGLSCCMLITLYLRHELNYDRYQKNLTDLYQLGTVFITQHEEHPYASTPAPMGAAIQKEFPEVMANTRLMRLFSEDKTLLQFKTPGTTLHSFYETGGLMADSTFFRLFTYHFIEGNAATSLTRPSTVVLSETIAGKLFGNSPALGKVIHISSATNGDQDFTVTGVFRPINSPSAIEGNFFMSMTGGNVEQLLKQQATDFATNNIFYTYLQLRPGADPAALTAKFPAFLEKYARKDLKAMGFDKRQFLVPLKDLHLFTGMEFTLTPPGSRTYLYILASVAVFTLLIACINFMNLATARSARRSAEVGVRKVLGAERPMLIAQFLGESVSTSLVAFLLAWGLTILLLPAFSKMTGTPLSLSLPEQFPLLVAFLGLAVFTGLLAGIYPAFYLSSFRPVQVLKGKFTNSLAAVSLRRGLVVFQFIISITLIIATVVINDQMRYLRGKDLGFEKDGQIILPLRSSAAKEHYSSLRNEIAATGQATDFGASMYYPGISNTADNLFYRQGQSMNDAKVTRMNYVDPGFLRTLGLHIVAGRLFSEQFPSDTSNRIILNENAIQRIGFASPAKAIGQKVFFDFQGQHYAFEIIGVVRDFHYEDLHVPITPYGFRLVTGSQFNYLMLHTRAGALTPLLRSLEASWHKLVPNEPFEYNFLDDEFQKNYQAEERLSAMVDYFTVMAILISCLGLFGLASFSAEQRIREIGIRKVLGAGTTGIVFLLSRDFIRLVAIGALIASPIAWFIMHRWLQDFAYKTSIRWTDFVLTFALALGIALFTIGFQATRAALANPARTLKTE